MDLSRYDLLSLRMFITVVDVGSLTAAARAHTLSLPAVSKRIRELETVVGVSLLVRSKVGVAPTAAGATLYQHAIQVNADVAQLSLAMSDFQRNIQARVRVWANTSAVTGFLPGFLSNYLQVRPAVTIDLEEVNSEPLVRAVESGAADLGIFADNVPGGSLHSGVCDVDQLVLVTPRAHALAHQPSVRWVQALEYDIVGLNRGSALMRLMDAESARLNLPLRLRVQVKSFDAVCHLVAAGLGLGLLPRAAARPQSQALPISIVPLHDDWARNRRLLVGWHANTTLQPHAALFRDMLIQRGEAAIANPQISSSGASRQHPAWA